jgi:hypothetical protein
MVKNLEETGTPFDYRDVDFGRPMNSKNDNHFAITDPPLTVGEDNNPDKNQIYIDKDKTFEDE